MNTSTVVTKDPVCGMSVDTASALSAERGGKTFYFCCDGCRKTFLAGSRGGKPEGTSKGCCD